ncbi:hypothetical protein VCRLGP7_740421 [Vibrio crassostreae]|nr:hypothetical protein VCRA2123E76_20563 [Vibrio crassostreae]CDT54195.1 hypothetical protein VCRLGP7_740421 [Vibrio crassostreae]
MHVIPLPIDLTVCQKRASTFVHSFIHSFDSLSLFYLYITDT